MLTPACQIACSHLSWTLVVLALQDAWDPPAEEGLYDIRVGTVCTKKGGYTQSYTPIVTGRVGDKAPVTLAVDMVDAEKRTSSVIATGADIAALVAENKREPHMLDARRANQSDAPH